MLLAAGPTAPVRISLMKASAIETAARTKIALLRLQLTSVSSHSTTWPHSSFSAFTPALPTTALWVTRVKTRLDR